jgi:hypothetical protein
MAKAIIENCASKSISCRNIGRSQFCVTPQSVVGHNQTVRTNENLERVWTIIKRPVCKPGSGRPIGATFKGQALGETSVTNYHSVLRKIPEESRSQNDHLLIPNLNVKNQFMYKIGYNLSSNQ